MENNECVPDEIGILIVSYLTHSISEEDLSRLNKWIYNSIENRNHFNAIKDAWILSGEKESYSISILELFPGFGSGNRRKSNFLKYLKLAASWLLIFASGSVLTLLFSDKPEKPITADGNKTIEISTPMGSTSLIRMPDNTQIWMNAGTTITYRQDYGLQSRVLDLVGEAFFNVSKDSLHTFQVNTQGIVVHALGTRFNVKAYPEEETITTTLEEGKVKVKLLNMSGRDEGVLLEPKDILIYSKAINEAAKVVKKPEEKIKPVAKSADKLRNVNIVSNVRTELYTSWKDTRWIIDKEPLSTLVPMLERRFNMKIIIEGEELAKYKFTGIVETETISQLMNALKFTAPVNYSISKDTLRLALDIKARDKFKKIMNRTN